MAEIAPTQNDIQVAFKSFLGAILPSGVEVITGQVNRVPEPASNNFVVMSPLRAQRLRTNVDSAQDVRFTGSIAGTTLTVTTVDFGTIEADAVIFGVDVAAGTRIVSGPGGVGTYLISQAQTLGSRTLASGSVDIEIASEYVMQLDFHTAGNTAFNYAQMVSAILRDPKGVEIFRENVPDGTITPLYADDPRQAPFTNENQQVEWRWILEAHLQVNQSTSMPQQYADQVEATLRSVDTLPL